MFAFLEYKTKNITKTEAAVSTSNFSLQIRSVPWRTCTWPEVLNLDFYCGMWCYFTRVNFVYKRVLDQVVKSTITRE